MPITLKRLLIGDELWLNNLMKKKYFFFDSGEAKNALVLEEFVFFSANTLLCSTRIITKRDICQQQIVSG